MLHLHAAPACIPVACCPKLRHLLVIFLKPGIFVMRTMPGRRLLYDQWRHVPCRHISDCSAFLCARHERNRVRASVEARDAGALHGACELVR